MNNFSDIAKQLEGYELIKNIMILRKMDTIQYIRKDNGKFVNDKTILYGNKKKGYLLLQGFNKNGKVLRYTVPINDIIIFRKKDT